MNDMKHLLNAYYEKLHRLLSENRKPLIDRTASVLETQIAEFGDFDTDKTDAYHETCVAFIDERIEMYNPIGLQYTFEPKNRRFAQKLQAQFDWYDSSGEFSQLKRIIKNAYEGLNDDNFDEIVTGIIEQAGAFPDKSIIEGFREQPDLQKLPDYVISLAIEDLIGSKKP